MTDTIKAGNVFSYRNTHPEGKENQISSYYDGLYVALDDEAGGFVPAIKFDMPPTGGKDGYYTADRKNIDRAKSVIKYAEVPAERMQKFIAALREYANLPNVLPKLGWQSYVYTRAEAVALELESIFQFVEEPTLPVADVDLIRIFGDVYGSALCYNSGSVESAKEALQVFRAEIGR